MGVIEASTQSEVESELLIKSKRPAVTSTPNGLPTRGNTGPSSSCPGASACEAIPRQNTRAAARLLSASGEMVAEVVREISKE
jgi:hypothetical protein